MKMQPSATTPSGNPTTAVTRRPASRRLIVSGLAIVAALTSVGASGVADARSAEGSPAAERVAATPDRPTVEVLRLKCVRTPQNNAACRWSQPTEGARVLTLWRSVDGGTREQVVSFEHRFPTSYRDDVPAGASKVFYAVIATDGAGEIVARSRADGVRFPGPQRVQSSRQAVVD